MSTRNLPEAVITALEKGLGKLDTARPPVGSHHVDTVISVRIAGDLYVAPDTEKTPTVSIPVKEVLALFIARSGATREASVKLLKTCIADALAMGSTKATGSIAEAADIDSAFSEAVTAMTAGLPKTPVKGAVKFKGEVEIL